MERNIYDPVVDVTHGIDQARRLADHAVFMGLGESIEAGRAIFYTPSTGVDASVFEP